MVVEKCVTVTVVSPPECTPDQTQRQTCPDGNIITTRICVDGKWQETGEICPIVPPSPKPKWPIYAGAGAVVVTGLWWLRRRRK